MDNFRAAFRSLLSTPVTTLVVVLTLAIGIGANTAIFSVVNGLLLRPLGYGDDSELVVLWSSNESEPTDYQRLSPADYRDMRDGVEAFGGEVLLYRMIGSTLTGADRPSRVGSMVVTARMFRVLDSEPLLGEFFSDDDERPGGEKKLVMTHATWTRRFGADREIVGTVIQLDNEPYRVLGVTQPGFQFPPGNEEVEVYFPMGLSDAVLLDRNHRMFDAVARLDAGVSLGSAQQELDSVAARLAQEFPDTNAGWGVVAKSMRDELVGGLTTTLWVLSSAVFLVLLIACANIANVLLARSTAASREFAVRAALGAQRGDLLKRSLAESVLLGLVGGLGGGVLALWGRSMLVSILPPELARGGGLQMDATVLAYAAALSIGSIVLFGLFPALRSMGSDVIELLRPSGMPAAVSGGGGRLRETVVVIEVALAIVLLVAAGLLIRSFSRLSEVDPGFRKEGVVSVAVQLPGSHYSRAEWRPFFERLVERVENLPGVISAGAVSDLPMSDVGLGFEMEFQVEGLDAISPTLRPNADVRLMMPGYFRAMGMDILRGRSFDTLDATRRPRVAIVNQTLVDRYFEGRGRDVDPVGRTLRIGMLGDVEVVGIVSDIHHQGLESKYEAELFLPYGPISTRELHIVVHSEMDTPTVGNAVASVLAEMDNEIAPSRVVALSDLLWNSVAQPRFNTALLSGLALCAALLAMVGTYGIVAYSVSQRTGEIGLRMALGADSSATVAMILRRALTIVVTGALLGIVASLGVSRFLGELLFEVPPTDPVIYSSVFLAAVVVGLLAAWTPARRATRIDPVTALRNE